MSGPLEGDTRWVLAGCPARNRAWVLPEYLAALGALAHPRKWFLFVENHSTDKTDELLRNWSGNAAVFRYRGDDAPGHRRGEYGRNGYAYLADVRNFFLRAFLATPADYLLSVDSDVIVPPNLLDVLLPLADERTIVAAAISNIDGRELDGRVPGNFLVQAGGVLCHPTSYPTSGVLEVDVTGACCLIPRALVEAGVRYAPHHQGEDIPFCQAAKAAGGRIAVTFNVRPQHRMKEPVA